MMILCILSPPPTYSNTQIFIDIIIFPLWFNFPLKSYIMKTNYLEKSKLRTLPINLDGIRSQVMFTSWSWNLLTLSLALNGIITLLSESNSYTILHSIFLNQWVLRSAIVMFQVASSISMLVSVVVRYGELAFSQLFFHRFVLFLLIPTISKKKLCGHKH